MGEFWILLVRVSEQGQLGGGAKQKNNFISQLLSQVGVSFDSLQPSDIIQDGSNEG